MDGTPSQIRRCFLVSESQQKRQGAAGVSPHSLQVVGTMAANFPPFLEFLPGFGGINSTTRVRRTLGELFLTALVGSCLILPSSLCAAAQSQQPAQSREVIKISTRLVVVDAQVLNRKTQKAIANLRGDDFLVYEDGVLQEVTHFSKDKLPISVVLLFDITWSLHPVLKQLASNALKTLEHLKPEDEVALIAFGSAALLVEDFTPDRQKIAAAIEHAANHYSEIEHSVGGSAQLNEGVYQAAAYSRKHARPGNRRVVVILNDGLANIAFRSVHSEKEAFAELFESGVTICGLVARGWRSDLGEALNCVVPWVVVLRRLNPPGSVYKYAAQTGGEVIKASQGDANTRLAELFDHLRKYYTLGYVSSNPKLDGRFRTIKVKLKPEIEKREGNSLAVFAKRGYYALPRNTP
jgi:VWFA-related protein